MATVKQLTQQKEKKKRPGAAAHILDNLLKRGGHLLLQHVAVALPGLVLGLDGLQALLVALFHVAQGSVEGLQLCVQKEGTNS
jgi:hypothetical protein